MPIEYAERAVVIQAQNHAMLKNIIFSFTIANLVGTSALFAQFNHEWSFANGGIYSEHIYDLCIDNEGCLYVIGQFASPFDFDPSTAIVFPDNVSSANLFFAKYDSDGNLLFVKSIGENLFWDSGYSIDIDAEKNIYISGSVANGTDMDTGPGQHIIQTLGSEDAFFAKYDSVGNFIFSTLIHTLASDAILDYSKSNNIYVYGILSEINDFDPGPGEFIIDGTNLEIPYLAKYGDDGTFRYAIGFDTLYSEAPYTYHYMNSLKGDSQGNCYITGLFRGAYDFDPGPGVFPVYSFDETLYFAKFDAEGELLFVKALGGSPGSYFSIPDIVLDDQSNIYIADNFTSQVDFDPGSGEALRTAYSNWDIFFAKYDSLGNFIFVKTMEGTGEYDFSSKILLGENDDIYLGGVTSGTTDLDPGTGEAIYTVPEYTDLFIAIYDNDGNYLTSISMGGDYQEAIRGMALDPSGNIYIAGEFYENHQLDPLSTNYYYSNGYEDIFIAKYSQEPVRAVQPADDGHSVSASPNPSPGLFRIDVPTGYSPTLPVITDMTGRFVEPLVSFQGTEWLIDLRSWPAGVYVANIRSGEKIRMLKLVKI